jgi:hypothetical protein
MLEPPSTAKLLQTYQAGRRLIAHAGVLHYSAAHFLGSLVLLIVISPFLESLPWGDLIEAVLLTFVLLSAVLAVGGRRRVLSWAIALLIPTLLARWANRLYPAYVPSEISLVAGLVFGALIVSQLFRFILRAPRVNTEVLCAGVAGYLTLGLLWGVAYALAARLDPNAFSSGAGPGYSPSMRGFTVLYFSFITLSTVGYGDITPASSVARMLAMTEAMVGTFYVAILVARLVTLYSSQPHPDSGASTPNSENSPTASAS